MPPYKANIQKINDPAASGLDIKKRKLQKTLPRSSGVLSPLGIKLPCPFMDRAIMFKVRYAATDGLNLYPYTIIPRSSPSLRIFRVTISTGMPICTES